MNVKEWQKAEKGLGVVPTFEGCRQMYFILSFAIPLVVRPMSLILGDHFS